jgi:hypothetical protein
VWKLFYPSSQCVPVHQEHWHLSLATGLVAMEQRKTMGCRGSCGEWDFRLSAPGVFSSLLRHGRKNHFHCQERLRCLGYSRLLIVLCPSRLLISCFEVPFFPNKCFNFHKKKLSQAINSTNIVTEFTGRCQTLLATVYWRVQWKGTPWNEEEELFLFQCSPISSTNEVYCPLDQMTREKCSSILNQWRVVRCWEPVD